jgi:hypothetical protein
MLLRLTLILGDGGTAHKIIVMNDTGSDLLTLFTIDLPQLVNFQGYVGWLGQVPRHEWERYGYWLSKNSRTSSASKRW